MSYQTKVGLKHLAGKINLNTQQLLALKMFLQSKLKENSTSSILEHMGEKVIKLKKDNP